MCFCGDECNKTPAYHWTRTPPEHARRADNVVVHLDGLENDFVQPQDSAATALFRDPVEGRSAISDQWLFNHVVNAHPRS